VEDLETGSSWTVVLVNPWFPVDVHLLDDGSLLTFDDWGTMGSENTAVYYTSTGEPAWVHSLDEILPSEVLEDVPTSLSGSQWRAARDLEVLVSRDAEDRALATVTLWNEDRLTLRLADGVAWVVEVEDPGDDVGRLLRRARALERQGEDDDALDALNRLVDLGVEDSRMAREAADLLSALGAGELALRVLEPYLALHPVEPGLDAEGEWLWITTARVYDGLDWTELRDTTYLAICEALPGSWKSFHALAQELLFQGDDRAAFELLDRYFQHFVEIDAPDSDRKRAAQEAGRLLARLRRYPQALHYFDVALQATSRFDFSLAREYARCLGAAGQRNEAIGWWRRIAEWARGQGDAPSYERLADEADAEILRLTPQAAPTD
jgi:tetratricopeptide (TPR) repeat protein